MNFLIIPMSDPESDKQLAIATKEATAMLKAGKERFLNLANAQIYEASQYFHTRDPYEICQGLSREADEFHMAVLVACGSQQRFGDGDGAIIGHRIAQYCAHACVPKIGYIYCADAQTRLNLLKCNMLHYVTQLDTPQTLAELAHSMAITRFAFPQMEGIWQDICVNYKAQTVSIDHQPCQLPRREYQIIEVMMRQQGGFVSKQQIFNNVYGVDSDHGVTTVESHISKLRKKLREQSKIFDAKGGITHRYIGYNFFPSL